MTIGHKRVKALGEIRKPTSPVRSIFGTRQREVSVAYVGIAIDQPGDFGTITKVDRNGPAQKAGIQVGDRIQGFWPATSRDLVLDEEKTREYPFGLLKFPVGETIHLGIKREVEEMTVDLEPTAIYGIAYALGFVVSDEKNSSCFSTESLRVTDWIELHTELRRWRGDGTWSGNVERPCRSGRHGDIPLTKRGTCIDGPTTFEQADTHVRGRDL